jgi:S1-C subfamily serine protease
MFRRPSWQIGLLTLLAAALFAPRTVAQADAGDKVYQQALRSTVWTVVPTGPGRVRLGSGALIDTQQRLVVTNYHVVRDSEAALVMFPVFEKGRGGKSELVVEMTKYRNVVAEQGLRGKVLHTEPRCDLALIQLEKLPPGTPALRLAGASASPGQRIHSIGNPAVSDALWVYTPGSVRSVYRKQMRVSSKSGTGTFDIDARIVETSSPVNPGDSGGPVLNDKGELVAVTQGHAADSEARAVSYFIDIRELLDLLTAKKIKLSNPPTAVAASAEQLAPPGDKPAGDAAEKQAAFDLVVAKSLLNDGKRDRARERLQGIVEKYPASKSAAEAKQMLEKMDK